MGEHVSGGAGGVEWWVRQVGEVVGGAGGLREGGAVVPG